MILIKNAKDLGSLIRTKRKEIGMTQADFAGLCNVGTRFISELENGKPTLEFDRVLRVTQLIGIDLFSKGR
ncbi:helix-turn-helix transcriptional regulator [Desulfoluna spongiiphila]|uniref:helix-turn-helix transcriptional regulator n=1 Tax=Desulfoluna spongiiphila TaxID=419481 RepID=UPI00125EB006